MLQNVDGDVNNEYSSTSLKCQKADIFNRSVQTVKPPAEPNSWSRVLLEKLAVPQLVKKLHLRNGIQMPITLRHGTHILITRTVLNPNTHNPYV